MKIASLIMIVLEAFLLLTGSGCAFKSVNRTKNIDYSSADGVSVYNRQTLNIFAPKKHPAVVLMFIHGGSWDSGKKSLYNFFGNRMARKGVVVVIVDYPLSSQATYNGMARAVANATVWVKRNIKNYGGDPEKIFISGHSAGGHLASLVSLKDEYFDTLRTNNPIKGTILIDAAGLDMYGYLSDEKFPEDHRYIKTFTNNPEEWKAASPLYHLHDGMPPMLIFRGEKTYPSIIRSHEKFIGALRKFVPDPKYEVVKRKRHVPMITQFFNTWNPRYRKIKEFMSAVK